MKELFEDFEIYLMQNQDDFDRGHGYSLKEEYILKNKEKFIETESQFLNNVFSFKNNIKYTGL